MKANQVERSGGSRRAQGARISRTSNAGKRQSKLQRRDFEEQRCSENARRREPRVNYGKHPLAPLSFFPFCDYGRSGKFPTRNGNPPARSTYARAASGADVRGSGGRQRSDRSSPDWIARSDARRRRAEESGEQNWQARRKRSRKITTDKQAVGKKVVREIRDTRITHRTDVRLIDPRAVPGGWDRDGTVFS